MPSKNMLPKGKRRQTVKPAYRAHRTSLQEAQDEASKDDLAPESGTAAEAAQPELKTTGDEPAPVWDVPLADAWEVEDGIRRLAADAAANGKRLDAYLAKALPEVSRVRVQLLIEGGHVRVDGKPAKASLKLAGGEQIEIEGEPQPAPLKAEPEDIPLSIVYEDDDLAVIDKPAGMTVHAGAGDAEHNRGTLVNALLFHFGKQLSQHGGELRPGIVHRLDKDTSGLILVAKNDVTHRKMAEMFAGRTLRKVYIALVHGSLPKDEGTIALPIGRDPVRRIRMTTKLGLLGPRAAVSHWRVLERIGNKDLPGPLGAFTLLEVHIETGRTHQIRVHLAALGHPVVGDTLYGAPGKLKITAPAGPDKTTEPTLDRNFLHAAELDFDHPRTGKALALRAPLPSTLHEFLDHVRPRKGTRSAKHGA